MTHHTTYHQHYSRENSTNQNATPISVDQQKDKIDDDFLLNLMQIKQNHINHHHTQHLKTMKQNNVLSRKVGTESAPQSPDYPCPENRKILSWNTTINDLRGTPTSRSFTLLKTSSKKSFRDIMAKCARSSLEVNYMFMKHHIQHCLRTLGFSEQEIAETYLELVFLNPRVDHPDTLTQVIARIKDRIEEQYNQIEEIPVQVGDGSPASICYRLGAMLTDCQKLKNSMEEDVKKEEDKKRIQQADLPAATDNKRKKNEWQQYKEELDRVFEQKRISM